MMDINQTSGEARLKARNRTFRLFVVFGVAIGIGIGFFSGFSAALIERGLLPSWLVFPAMALGLAAFIWYSRVYFRRVDELDLADNLWASLIGLYFYIIALPTWSALNFAGFVGAPDQWVIWLATLVFSGAVYSARKLGMR